MFVYTFWEPREKIPYYIQLCMQTWKKFLPNAEIVVLDYKNIGNYIDMRELGLELFSGRFNLAHVSDAIRVALLAKRGGIWLDADTIILNSDAEKYFLPDEQNRTVFFGYPDSRKVHMAFINTPSAAKCMNVWFEFMKERLRNLKPSTEINPFFLGNSFINPFAKFYLDEINVLDAKLVMPELKIIPQDEPLTLANCERHYPIYYFEQNRHLRDVADYDMLMLHNSWAGMFGNLSPEEVLRCDCTMTNVLAEALDIKLPSPSERVRIKIENQKWTFVPAEPPKKRFRLVSLEDRIQPKIEVPTLRPPVKTPSKAEKMFIYTF
ncbi:MAG: hypothetical protein SR1Q7_09935 [Quinella sp. 1Q7]|nr:hypothetical protein [Quinella sp. 1Q7]